MGEDRPFREQAQYTFALLERLFDMRDEKRTGGCLPSAMADVILRRRRTATNLTAQSHPISL
jgi:hypothetical protein